MRPFISILAVLTFAAGSAAAQDADTAQAPTAGADAAEAGAAAPEAAQAGAPTAGQLYIREEHGDWQVRCLRAPEGQADPCEVFQRLADEQGNPTADVTIVDVGDGAEVAAIATIVTPLQTLLTADVAVTIDGGERRAYPFVVCDEQGCYARYGLTEAQLNAYRRGSSARVVVVPFAAPDQPVNLTMSLSGITAGLAAIAR